ncbi:ParB N-terminal domain-containing protein [Paenibacillus terrigena]|uniref:ParB N-terminal domain-containing protein n=1 Tax=Paenibacillus terrigena TaxID=369333 RepID=UPI0012EB6BC6|nr:ParB N-terminal domain-containing protein [Paenibacillus terrigena]
MSDQLGSFDPTSHECAYMLSKYDCFRKLTGKCSLLLPEEEVKQYTDVEINTRYEDHKENSVLYCRLLMKSLLEKGFIYPVEISSCSCGHYVFTNGQHRTCIAKTINITSIPALYGGAWDSDCRVCYFKKTSLNYRIKDLLGKNTEFIR